MLAKEIRDGWATSATGYASVIPSITKCGYEGWTIKTGNSYGVALPVPQDMVVSEKFAGAHLYTDTIILDGSKTRYALLLMARSEDIKIPFSSLCSELLNPGINGEFRKEILSSPTTWWTQWKELLGNRNVDERVYDVLGELLTLRYLAAHGENAEWNGPTGATYDIDCDGKFYEVKSTTARNKREITLSNHFQLDPPNGFPLFLVLCQIETAQSGDSINSLVSDLACLGYSTVALNEKLESLGFEKGKSARNRQYILHAMLEYKVDDSFPAIKDESFVGGHLPKGVRSITYTVSLDGLDATNLKIRQVSDET